MRLATYSPGTDSLPGLSIAAQVVDKWGQFEFGVSGGRGTVQVIVVVPKSSAMDLKVVSRMHSVYGGFISTIGDKICYQKYGAEFIRKIKPYLERTERQAEIVQEAHQLMLNGKRLTGALRAANERTLRGLSEELRDLNRKK